MSIETSLFISFTLFCAITVSAENIPLRGPISFDMFDLDNDKFVSSEEFHQVRNARWSEKARRGDPLKKVQFAVPFSDIDTNQDNLITREEFNAHQMSRKNMNAKKQRRFK